MQSNSIHGVQTFVTSKGKLAQGRFFECKSAGEACRIAEEKVRLGTAVGAAAFVRQSYGDEFDDGEEPITLATFGRVPAAVADQLPF